MQPSQWVFVLCRGYARLLSGVGELCADRAVYTWPQRNLPAGSHGTGMPVEDYCYSNTCTHRGAVHTVKACPNCGVRAGGCPAWGCHGAACLRAGRRLPSVHPRAPALTPRTREQNCVRPAARGRGCASSNSTDRAATQREVTYARTHAREHIGAAHTWLLPLCWPCRPQVAKYCSSGCQQQHWAAGHCRMCPRLADGKLRAKLSGQHTARAGGVEQSRLGR
jgi:hypothetical protein